MAESHRRSSPSLGNSNITDEVVYASAFFQSLQGLYHNQPEKRLLMAILENAIKEIQRYHNFDNKRGKESFREAYEWMLANESHLTSFITICRVLDLDPYYIRKGMKKWIQDRS